MKQLVLLLVVFLAAPVLAVGQDDDPLRLWRVSCKNDEFTDAKRCWLSIQGAETGTGRKAVAAIAHDDSGKNLVFMAVLDVDLDFGDTKDRFMFRADGNKAIDISKIQRQSDSDKGGRTAYVTQEFSAVIRQLMTCRTFKVEIPLKLGGRKSANFSCEDFSIMYEVFAENSPLPWVKKLSP